MQNKTCQFWEKKLSLDLTETQWENIFENILMGTTNMATQENSYKVLTRWYRVPNTIHKFAPSVSNQAGDASLNQVPLYTSGGHAPSSNGSGMKSMT